MSKRCISLVLALPLTAWLLGTAHPPRDRLSWFSVLMLGFASVMVFGYWLGVFETRKTSLRKSLWVVSLVFNVLVLVQVLGLLGGCDSVFALVPLKVVGVEVRLELLWPLASAMLSAYGLRVELQSRDAYIASL